MKRLLFDCSGEVATVAVFDGCELCSEISVGGSRKHAAILLPAIDRCLNEAGYSFSDVDEVYVCSGPGSFTGVKVGLATAMGLVQPTEKSLYVFPYAALILGRALTLHPRLLDGVSADYRDHSVNGEIHLCQDAGRGETYRTVLRLQEEGWEIAEARLVKPEEMPADGDADRAISYPDLAVRELFALPESVLSLFLSREIEPLYFRKSQAEEARGL